MLIDIVSYIIMHECIHRSVNIDEGQSSPDFLSCLEQAGPAQEDDTEQRCEYIVFRRHLVITIYYNIL